MAHRVGTCPTCRSTFNLGDTTATKIAALLLGGTIGGAATRSIWGVLALLGLSYLVHEALVSLDERCPTCGAVLRIALRYT